MRTCDLCQKEIVGRQKSARFCSGKCGSLYHYYKSGKNWRLKNKPKKEYLECKICKTVLDGKKKLFCSKECKSKYHSNSSYKAQQARGLRRKLELIRIKGGKCSSDSCPVPGGYARNAAALVFHHRDESQKAMSLDLRHLSNRSWDLILNEASKCDLLCQICHHELHHPQLKIKKPRWANIEAIGPPGLEPGTVRL